LGDIPQLTIVFHDRIEDTRAVNVQRQIALG
jgi:hypothetical protein